MLLKYYLLAVAALSGIAFVLYGMDKAKARRRRWRIPEATLLTFGILGGAPGALLGMLAFRHKTRHAIFWIVNFLSLALHATLVVYLIK